MQNESAWRTKNCTVLYMHHKVGTSTQLCAMQGGCWAG